MTSLTTSLAVEQLDAERHRALDESGWGRKFRFFQPRNLCFWVFAYLVVNGIFSFVATTSGQFEAFGSALIAGAIVFGLYGALFWWFTQRIDRYSRQPVRLMVAAFLWGGFVATWMMAGVANTPIRSLYAKAFGQAWMLDWSASLTAPFTEEFSKAAGLILIIAIAPRIVRTAFDGFVLGAFIGLGFEVLEDLQYSTTAASTQFGANQLDAFRQTTFLRLATGATSHIVYSSIFCAGLVYFLGTTGEPRRRGRGLALMVMAMLLHGIWDSLGATAGRFGGSGQFVGLFATMTLAVVIVVWVFHITVGRERGHMRDVMAPEVAHGVITDSELDALAGDRKARKSYLHSGHGHHDKKHAKHLLAASHDLADAVAASGGVDTDAVNFARREVARVRATT